MAEYRGVCMYCGTNISGGHNGSTCGNCGAKLKVLRKIRKMVINEMSDGQLAKHMRENDVENPVENVESDSK